MNILCGFSGDKPYAEMYQTLKERSQSILLTEPTYARNPPNKGYRNLGPFESNPKSALERVLRNCGPEDTVLVSGSLYLVGEVRGWFAPGGGALAS